MSSVALLFATLGATAFPEAFHGIWDVSPEACAGQTSTVRIAIKAKQIDYWESSGKPVEIFSGGDRDIRVTLDMEGEGEKWKSQTRFIVDRSGELLFAEALPMRDKPYYKTVWFYHRCPNDTAMGW